MTRLQHSNHPVRYMRHTMKCVYDSSIKAVEQTKGVREGDESLQPNGVHVDLMSGISDRFHSFRKTSIETT